MKVLSLDVGGTAVKSAIVAEDGIVSSFYSTPSSASPAEVLTQYAIDVAKKYNDYDILAVSMTGQIDHSTQMTLAKGNGMGLERAHFPVGKIIREAVQRPVFVLNDANAAALGEAFLGAGRKYRNFVCLTYGTGVGGGIIQNGRLLTGHHGIAGELGHIVIHAGGLRCRCGHHGCYQEYASTTALLREARKHFPMLRNGRELFEYLGNEPILQQVVDSWISEIVEGLCSLSYIFDPECFVLGGGVMERPEVLEQVRCQFRNRVIPSFSDIEICKAELGNYAGMIGAAAYARWAMSEENDGTGVGYLINRKEV